MKKKKKRKKKYSFKKGLLKLYKNTILRIYTFMMFCIIVIILAIVYFPIECSGNETNCYKTECNIWGCGKVQVDMDSAQCEIKRDECSWRWRW